MITGIIYTVDTPICGCKEQRYRSGLTIKALDGSALLEIACLGCDAQVATRFDKAPTRIIVDPTKS